MSGYRPRRRPVVLLLGDSLTEQGGDPNLQGWVSLLQSQFCRSIDVVPRGLSGYNTRWYLKYAMPMIRGEILSGLYTPTFITLWLGANDAVLPFGSRSKQHVPLDTYQQNLVQLVEEVQSVAPHASILMITPPYVDDTERARQSYMYSHGLMDRLNNVTGTYAAACVETARNLSLPVLDLYALLNAMPKRKRNRLLKDGVHFNPKGHKLVYKVLVAKIIAEFPRVARKLVKWQLPKYQDLPINTCFQIVHFDQIHTAETDAASDVRNARLRIGDHG
ncbi:hypothetical protein PsorP6_007856 [Peronosclerospora sorghi]|uniref:Uncharacterized protein n=1 Tax=Peronosclerospora sorghi TaxID=230839 RepID=A0ACC0WAZ0_9STRA|nr:hypothetical protein PsorP6_007856 [Peronosclerospora sorghi]